ncbi:hypothetical protein O6H91_02G072900 [Diphasiastrum complanatum]|uniref:Uncharacterized protein n=1 Tax=Diphasiastrum complanatum TaxID=34168 RepID=A0ACC2EGP2_DIPCM|nr:hypothetical protein O6H91_02G072900 [Diphasiastrum complanatum]
MNVARSQQNSIVQKRVSFCSQNLGRPAIHKAEKRYEVFKISDEEHLKQRLIKAILNKLTPQNFDKLFAQVKGVQIETAATLTGVIAQIYDKALMEPTFCEMYARFCVQLAVELPELIENGEKITFKRLLLDKCQEEFESGEREQKAAVEEEQDGRIKVLDEERERKRWEARKRTLGNVLFIGELYKKRMLTERIMHECIRKLLGEDQQSDEEDIEALCKLMTTIGQLIDHAKARSHLDVYFKRINELSNDEKLSSRLRFMLKDVIELRRNGWSTRQKIEGPKKIEDLHRDVAQERKGVSVRNRNSGRKNRMGYSESGIHSLASSTSLQAPAGVHVTMKGAEKSEQYAYGQDVRMNPRFLSECSTLSISDEGSVTYRAKEIGRDRLVDMQPSISEHCVLAEAPSVGVTIKGAQKSEQYVYGQDVKHCLLAEAPDIMLADRRHTGVGSEVMLNYSVVPDTGICKGANALSSENSNSYWLNGLSERPVLQRPLDMHQSIPDRDQVSERPNGSGCFHQPVMPITSVSARASVLFSPMLVKEQLRKKVEEAVNNYYSVRDVNEAAEYVSRLKVPIFQSGMVSIWIWKLLEEGDDAKCELLAKLLVHLCWMEQPLLTLEHLIQGFLAVLSLLENAMIGSPKAPDYLARLIGKLVAYGLFSLNEVGKLLRDGGHETGRLLQTGETLNMFGVILDTLRKEKGENVMVELFEASKLVIEDFFLKDKKMLIEFLKETKLQCLYPVVFMAHIIAVLASCLCFIYCKVYNHICFLQIFFKVLA